jgi:hypothetical protein
MHYGERLLGRASSCAPCFQKKGVHDVESLEFEKKRSRDRLRSLGACGACAEMDSCLVAGDGNLLATPACRDLVWNCQQNYSLSGSL